jgi:hypothetical protein
MKPKRTVVRTLARLGAFSVLLQVLLVSASISVAGAAPAAKPTFPQPYPWSRTASATTGNYIADSYNGVGADTPIENVTTARLLDILSSNGNYYIVFGGPEHPTSQAVMAAINAQAKADGITKIYHFDPYLDGYRLDVTDSAPGGVGSWIGGTSMNYGGNAAVHEVWRSITDLLPHSAVTTGGALDGYKGDETLLLSVSVTDRTNVETGKIINGSYELAPADLASFNATAARTAISAVFHRGPGETVIPSSERSQYYFFKRVYNATASNHNFNGGTATANNIGSAVQIFSDTDFPGGAGFPLVAIDIKQLYNLLNSPGEHAILFAGMGCHNTQAIIGSVALRAKALGLSTVYVVDLALNSNVKFGTGSDIDTATAMTATGGLWIRGSVTPTSNKFSYLYGEMARYLGNWVTENSSKKNNSVTYYPNGDVDGLPTTNPYVSLGGGVYADNPALGDNIPNARRLQVPFLIAYNKDAVQPVTHQWLHLDSGSTETTKVYTEYMLELAWVRDTPLAAAVTTPVVDGLTPVQFATEAVAALDGVLGPVKNYVAAYSAAPSPTVSGTAKVGRTLASDPGTWFPVPSFGYRWYANGVAIPGATGSHYLITTAVLGKHLSVKVTGTKPGFPTLAKTSKQTAVVTADFMKAPNPRISGTARIGKTLRVVTGTWSPKPTFTYQWYANGKKIQNATKSTLKLTAALKGKKIAVAVTAKKANYVTLTKTSSATAKVTK